MFIAICVSTVLGLYIYTLSRKLKGREKERNNLEVQELRNKEFGKIRKGFLRKYEQENLP
jgi:hypothetical protein